MICIQQPRGERYSSDSGARTRRWSSRHPPRPCRPRMRSDSERSGDARRERQRVVFRFIAFVCFIRRSCAAAAARACDDGTLCRRHRRRREASLVRHYENTRRTDINKYLPIYFLYFYIRERCFFQHADLLAALDKSSSSLLPRPKRGAEKKKN